MNRIVAHSFDPPPDADDVTVEDYLLLVEDLTRDPPIVPKAMGLLVTDARASLVLARRIVSAVQILRDTGELDPAIAFFLISLFVTWGIGEFTDKDPVLCSLSDQMRAIERAHGRDPDDPEQQFGLDDATPDWLEINDEWDRRAVELEIALLRAMGEPEMASMRELREEQFDARCSEGRQRLERLRPPDARRSGTAS